MSQPVRGPGRPPGPGRGKGGRSTSGVRPPKAKRGVEVVVGRPSVSGVGHPPGFRQGIGTGNTPGEDEVLIINSIEDIKVIFFDLFVFCLSLSASVTFSFLF